jgi:hypothetical protein
MQDEAASHYAQNIDQMTLGMLFLERELGFRPSVGWHIGERTLRNRRRRRRYAIPMMTNFHAR